MLKTKGTNTARPIQNIVQNQCRPPVVVNNSPENQHDFRSLKTVPGENSYNDVVKDCKGNENKIVIFSNSYHLFLFIFISSLFKDDVHQIQ